MGTARAQAIGGGKPIQCKDVYPENNCHFGCFILYEPKLQVCYNQYDACIDAGTSQEVCLNQENTCLEPFQQQWKACDDCCRQAAINRCHTKNAVACCLKAYNLCNDNNTD
jgi:hypothetical protein